MSPYVPLRKTPIKRWIKVEVLFVVLLRNKIDYAENNLLCLEVHQSKDDASSVLEVLASVEHTV